MDIALWIVAVVVALIFLAFAYVHGVGYERTKERVAWVAAIGRRSATVLAVLEALGALGLVLPLATNALVWLTPVAGLCLALLMVFAIPFHAVRREWPNIVLNVILGAMAVFVAYGRWDLLGR